MINRGEIRKEIIEYLKKKKCFVSRFRICMDLSDRFSNSSVSQELREMRRENKIKYGLRRWGLPIK